MNPPLPIIQIVPTGGGLFGIKFKDRSRKAENNAMVKITRLDLLHTQTLLSLATEGKKLPPAKGTVDYKLTKISTAVGTEVIKHEEIPLTSAKTQNSSQTSMESLKNQFLNATETMKPSEHKRQLIKIIEGEIKWKTTLTLRSNQLNDQIDQLKSLR